MLDGFAPFANLTLRSLREILLEAFSSRLLSPEVAQKEFRALNLQSSILNLKLNHLFFSSSTVPDRSKVLPAWSVNVALNT
jgi:hypothetical protein